MNRRDDSGPRAGWHSKAGLKTSTHPHPSSCVCKCQKSFTPSVKNLCSHASSAEFSSFIWQLREFSVLASTALPRSLSVPDLCISEQRHIVSPHKREQEGVSAKPQPGTTKQQSLLETGSKLKRRCCVSLELCQIFIAGMQGGALGEAHPLLQELALAPVPPPPGLRSQAASISAKTRGLPPLTGSDSSEAADFLFGAHPKDSENT